MKEVRRLLSEIKKLERDALIDKLNVYGTKEGNVTTYNFSPDDVPCVAAYPWKKVEDVEVVGVRLIRHNNSKGFILNVRDDCGNRIDMFLDQVVTGQVQHIVDNIC